MVDNFSVTVSNHQVMGNERESFDVITTGSLRERNGKRYILYRVYDEDCSKGELTTVKIDYTGERKIVTVNRNNDKSGDHVNLILEEGRRHLCEYNTPVGTLLLGIATKAIHDELTEEGGVLKLRYTIDVNGEVTSHNSVDISLIKMNQGE